MSEQKDCQHENMEMVYAPIVGGGGAVKEPIGEFCPDCGYSPEAFGGLAIAWRKGVNDHE